MQLFILYGPQEAGVISENNVLFKFAKPIVWKVNSLQQMFKLIFSQSGRVIGILRTDACAF